MEVYLKRQFTPLNHNWMFFLKPVVLFIHPDYTDVSCGALDGSAAGISASL